MGLSEMKNMRVDIGDMVLGAVEEKVDRKLSQVADDCETSILALRGLVTQQNTIIDASLASERTAHDEQCSAVKAALECLEASLRKEVVRVSEEQESQRTKLWEFISGDGRRDVVEAAEAARPPPSASDAGDDAKNSHALMAQMQDEVTSLKGALSLMHDQHFLNMTSYTCKLE